ncbi:sensor histidine kinase [Clostridium hydrogenum]|uniref:sensor histidine kinase n=1 Tax=Clostridium hydrogenum TaxID=2855764 RepID=UPI001F20E282|nr:sensor histidine kinase [Clostridium hydrogenum]
MLNDSITILGQTISIILGLFSIYIIFYFMGSLERNLYHKKYVYVLGYIFFTLAVFAAGVFHSQFIAFLINVIATVIAGHFLYNDKKIYLFYYSIFIVILGCFQIVVGFLFGQVCQLFNINFYSLDIFVITDSIIIQLSNLSAARLGIVFYKRKKIERITTVQFFNFLILPIFSIFYITTLLMYAQTYISLEDTILIVVNIASIIALNVYITNIFEAISNNNKLKNELMLYNEQAKMQYEYYNNLDTKYKNSRKIIHDIKNHMNAIEELYEQRETEKAKNYAEDMYKMFDKFVQKYYTSNKVLNIIINDKLSKAEQLGVGINCKIGDVNLEFIKDIDLTTIFSNLLDNAIEGTKTAAENKNISLKVDKFNEFIVINLINPTDKEPIQEKKGFKSTKKHHKGLGLENVRMALNKYEGNMRIEYKDKIFKVNIVIPVS